MSSIGGQIGTACASHIESITRLERDCFGSRAWSSRQVLGELKRAEGLHRLLEGHPPNPFLGLTLGWVIADEAELLRIAVHPRMRRRGIGSRLLHDFAEQAYERGARSCFLEVRADNQAAIALYRSHHFEDVSHRSAYYPDGCDAVLMRLSLTQ